MRKLHKWQILELVKTIKEAQTEGRKEDCRQLAQGTYNYICNIGLRSSQTAELLKEYLEMLNVGVIGETSHEILTERLNHIRFSAQSEFQANKIEVVFLSYKASMSDSLESIYFAARNDSNCNAYWIPIPYFDRRPDGTLGEMHYEGPECYTDSIVATDWRNYNIKAQRPDIIFTFNPYDGGNHVTSVHPDFYCERLRNLTELFVYVPYFVSSETANALAEHFCISAGSVYAHRVIVQSEKIRSDYIRAQKNHFGDKLDDAIGRPEDRFVALGSPKFDKVINSKRKDFALPETWSNLIGNKKVILYNSSLGTILLDTEQYLSKIRSVLDTFRKRKDIVLWWRPHPLSDATYKSMRPHIMIEYKKIVADYLQDGWGIFDDTPDLHRALAWTDAYYGDISSLVALYECTKKPIMIQSLWNFEDLKNTLSFENLCDDGNFYWFSVSQVNALFQMDKTTRQIDFIGSFPNENLVCYRLFYQLTYKDKKIYFAPLNAKNIAVFDIDANSFSSVPIKQAHQHLSGNNSFLDQVKFIFVTSFNNWIFIIPFAYPAIIRYNVESDNIDYFDDFLTLFQPFIIPSLPAIFSRGCKIDNYLFATSYNGNALLAFNMETCKSKIYRVGSNNNAYSVMCHHDGFLWLMPRNNGPIVKWKPHTSLYEEFSSLPPDFKGDNYSFIALIYSQYYLWAFPAGANIVLRIDPNTGNAEKAEIFQQECKAHRNPNTPRFSMAHSDGDTIIAQSGRGNLITYNCKTGEYKTETIRLSEKAKASLIPNLLQTMAASGIEHSRDSLSRLLRENSVLTLDALIDCLLLDDNTGGTLPPENATPLDRQRTAGEAIYRYCIGCLRKGSE
jgi:CDP-glycerol glycerophosphotransferase (TagB/SpsB family)